MITKVSSRLLAIAAFLLFPVLVSNADEQAILPPDAALMEARTLVKVGHFEKALSILRPFVHSHPHSTDLQFLVGFAAIEYSRQSGISDALRRELLNDSIQAFRTILTNRPELVRVRLELARAYFLKGEDGLARNHFERVLAGNPPTAVVANIQRFIADIRARRRWTVYFSAGLAPDTNIGASSDEEIIYFFDLPFRRTATDLTTSGVGLSIWTGGEYQYPLGNRVRLRIGGDVGGQEYAGSRFDRSSLSVHAGPRWLVGGDSEVSFVGNARRSWVGTLPQNDDLGARIEIAHRLTPQITVNGRGSWHRRDYRTQDYLDGPILSLSLDGTWTVTPTLQAQMATGYARERTESVAWRSTSRWLRVGASVALPLGLNLSGSGELRWTNFEGNWYPYTRDGSAREDNTSILRASIQKRDITYFGFSPQLMVAREVRETNAQLYDYKRTRGELRLVRQF